MSFRTLLMAAAARGSVPPGVTLDLNFMAPGTLDPRITFTRASIATYFDATGTLRTAATNGPRWVYNPGTLALQGMLIEEARTNVIDQSGDMSNAAWSKSNFNGPVAPVVTANATTAPDGTVTASMVAYPAVSGAGAGSVLGQGFGAAATPFALSVWLKGSVGGEQIWAMTTPDGATYYRATATLTTAWQRISVVTSALTAAQWFYQIGIDLRDASQSSKPAQTVYVWGAQAEQGAFVTSYIPTTSAGVTRAADQCHIAPANMSPWFASPGGSWQAEFIRLDAAAKQDAIVGNFGTEASMPMYLSSTNALDQWDGSGTSVTLNTVTPGSIGKGATSWAASVGLSCLNGGTVASGSMPTGYPALASSGVGLLSPFTAGAADNMAAGCLRRVRYWPRVLTNAEMQSVTR